MAWMVLTGGLSSASLGQAAVATFWQGYPRAHTVSEGLPPDSRVVVPSRGCLWVAPPADTFPRELAGAVWVLGEGSGSLLLLISPRAVARPSHHSFHGTGRCLP